MSPSISQSNPAVVLLVGGTKILERALQTAVQAPLVSVGTIEEAMRVLGEQPVGLVVFGPTLRRSLAMVATLRREGQAEPKLLVVYRDDQRDEVKRHMKGKSVADRYVIQSRIGKDLEPAAAELWTGVQAGQAGTNDDLEEIPMEALEDLHESHTREMDVLDLEEADLPPPAPGEILGAFDPSAFESGQGDGDLLDDMEEIELLDDGALEEMLPGIHNGTLELSLEDLVEELEPIELSDEDAGETVEDLDGIELVEELDAEVLGDELLEAEPLEAELIGEELLEMSDLEEEFEPLAALAETPPELAEIARPLALQSQPVQIQAVQIAAELTPIVFAIEDEPAPSAAAVHLSEKVTEAPARASRPSRNAVPAFAPADLQVAMAAQGGMALPTPEPPVVDRSPRQSGSHAMFSELNGFMERLQEMSGLTARLEAENEQLRVELGRLREQARPEIEGELRELRGKLSDLQVRFEGAEGARDAAVEARMKAEQSMRTRESEIANLRAEVSALQSREMALDSQLEASRRLAADASKTLRQMAEMLEA